MASYQRLRVRGACYFFSVNLADRESDLLVRHVDTLRGAVAETRRERPFRIETMVVLPDHLHAIWTLPEGDADFSTRWGAIKARFSMAMRRAGFTPPPPVGQVNGGVNPALRRKGEIGLWQPRFWEHCIRDERDFDLHRRYCWGNPVKHGYVRTPADWPYSSIHRDIRAGRVNPCWTGGLEDGDFGEA